MASGARCTSIYAGQDNRPALVRTTYMMAEVCPACLLLSHLQKSGQWWKNKSNEKHGRNVFCSLSSNASCRFECFCFFVFFFGQCERGFVVPPSLLTIDPTKVYNSVPGNRPAIRRMDLERPIYIQHDCPLFNSGKNWIGTYFFFLLQRHF